LNLIGKTFNINIKLYLLESITNTNNRVS